MTIRKLFLVLLAGMLLAGCSGAENAGTAQSDSGKATDFSLSDVNNRTVRLSDYDGKVIILNFFATWCPPCRAEIPDFIELVNDYKNKGLVIIGVSVDRGGVDTVKSFTSQYGINYPVLLDNGIVSKNYGPIQSIPTTFIINRNGKIIQKIIGSRQKSFFENIIKPLL